MDNNGYSLSDLAAVTGGENGFGGGGAWWIVLLFLVLFGGGGAWGGGNNRSARSATTEDLAAGFNFADLNNTGAAILEAVNREGRNTDAAVCQLGYQTLEQIGNLSAQNAQCCCELKTAIHAEGEATRAMFRENEIQALRDQVSALQLNSALCGVPRINTNAYGVYAYPGMGGCGCPQAAI